MSLRTLNACHPALHLVFALCLGEERIGVSVSDVSVAQPRSRLWLIMLAAMLWGTTGVTSRTLYSISAANPGSVSFFRLAIATPCLALACWFAVGRRAWRIAPRDFARMAALGTMLAVYQICFFAAITQVGVAVATLVTLSLAPILVALLAPVLTGERLTRGLLGALALALVGIICIVGVPNAASSHGNVALGALLASGSALGYALVTLISRSLGRYHPLQTTTVGFAVGAVVLLPLALTTGLVVHYPPQGWLLLLYLGTIPSALAYSLFLTGMAHIPATVASITTLLEPLTATLLATILLGERLTPLGLAGAGLLLGAVALLTWMRPAIA
jgi:DME family drug/metabolite transporter